MKAIVMNCYVWARATMSPRWHLLRETSSVAAYCGRTDDDGQWAEQYENLPRMITQDEVCDACQYVDVEAVVFGREQCYRCRGQLVVPTDPDDYWATCSGCGWRWQVRDGSIHSRAPLNEIQGLTQGESAAHV